jgi:hypothetical protein
MNPRLALLPILLLAACTEPRAADGAASSKTEAPAVAAPQGPRASQSDAEPEPPDFGDLWLFLDLDTLRWAEWETPVTGNRAARLQALGVTLIRSDSTGPREPVDASEMGDYDPYGENPRHFHLFDFSGDGVDDVVYSGPWYELGPNGFGALEGTRFKLYQVMNGRAVLVLSYPGAVQRIFRRERGQPVGLRAVIHGCCADPQWNVDYLAPRLAGDTVKYEPHLRLMGREGIEMPTRVMDRPRRFTVANDRYLLRESPAIDPKPAEDGEDWYRWEGHGNALSEYGRGARGVALAERTDETGRVWWFVRMEGRTPPRDAQIQDDPQDHVPTDRLGWMSSRFLTPEP